jgi:uncharacterized protein
MDLSHIPFADIPEDGLQLSGSLPASIFGLGPDDPRPLGPLDYHLDLLPSGDLLLVTGRIAVPFDLECVRCLHHFPCTIAIDPYTAEIEPAAGNMIHLTDRLREDILLVLPAYPRCDQSNDGRECPVGDRFTSLPADDADEDGDPSGPPHEGAWDILEDWKPRSED